MALFGSFVPPDDAEEQARLDSQLRSRRSVLDLVTGSRQRLKLTTIQCRPLCSVATLDKSTNTRT